VKDRRSGWHRAARALCVGVGLAGLFAAVAVTVVPQGQRGLRSGLGEPTDLAPGVHLIVRPLHTVTLRDETVRLLMGLRAARDNDVPELAGEGPPLTARTADHQPIQLDATMVVRLTDARADVDAVVRQALSQAVAQRPAQDFEVADTSALAADLGRLAAPSLNAGGLALNALHLVGVTLPPARQAELDQAQNTALRAAYDSGRQALLLRTAEVLAAERDAENATEDAERRLAEAEAAEDLVARTAQARRLAEVQLSLANAHARAEAEAMVIDAEADRVRDRALAEIQARLSVALDGPGGEAYVEWVGRGYDESATSPCPQPSERTPTQPEE
jgi:regulator of protease activity HflC (stomatin/prohibitin superfamily)